MCEFSTAGVASVISAVETLPVALPARCAFSSTVVEVLAGHLERGARALRDPLVDRLLPGRPHRPGRGRVGVVVGQQRRRARLHRPRGLEARERQPVDVHPPGRAVLVVAGGGDLLRAHPVAEEEDHVLRLAAVQLRDGPDRCGSARRRSRTTRRAASRTVAPRPPSATAMRFPSNIEEPPVVDREAPSSSPPPGGVTAR